MPAHELGGENKNVLGPGRITNLSSKRPPLDRSMLTPQLPPIPLSESAISSKTYETEPSHDDAAKPMGRIEERGEDKEAKGDRSTTCDNM